MARVNIEECWYSDPRRYKLSVAVGDIYKADGLAINMWRLAQKFWESDRALIPKGVFDSLDFAAELIRCGLAEIRDEEIYVRGSSQYLEWTYEQREKRARGGKNSAKARQEKYGTAIPINATNAELNPNRARTKTEVKPKSSEVSGSGSGSGSEEYKYSPDKPDCVHELSEEDFEKAYDAYPAKTGRSKARKRFFSEVTKKELSEFMRAIEVYTLDLAANSWRKPKLFETFVGSKKTGRPWLDLLDPDYGAQDHYSGHDPQSTTCGFTTGPNEGELEYV